MSLTYLLFDYSDPGIYFEAAAKTVFIYFFLILVMRIMGKREMAQISMFDVVVFFIISELLSLAINSRESTLMEAIIPIFIIMVLEIVTSLIILKYKRTRTLVEGKLTYIIYQGVIDQEAMKKHRYNLDDLMSELRNNSVNTPRDVQYAILEPKGKLSIITYQDSKVVFPDLLISDGKINTIALKKFGQDEQWLVSEIKKYGYERVEQVFLALLESGGLYVIGVAHSGAPKSVKRSPKRR